MALFSNNAIIILSSGLGIGWHIAVIFVSKRLNKIPLIARNHAQVQRDAYAITKFSGDKVQIKIYPAHISDRYRLSTTL